MARAHRPIGIDLFAGAGGMSLGFEQAGFDIAAAVEIDPIHCATHEYNFPHTKTICGSVIDIEGSDIRKLADLDGVDIDVVFGGAPCQGFSMIGKRALDDPRNQLVFHFVKLVRQLAPKYFVFENVRGLTLGTHKQFLNELIAAMVECEYDVLLPYEVLNAAHFGVPQDRQRLFLIGARKGSKLPRYPQRTGSTTVGEAIGDLPNVDDFSELIASDSLPYRWETESQYAQVLRGLRTDPHDFSYPREFDKNLLTSSLRTAHTKESRRRFENAPFGDTEPISRFKKLDPEGVCNTLRAGTDSARGAFTSPRPIHPFDGRVITVREAARIHSYPDWFRFHVTKWHGFRQIGNSVPPRLARSVAECIVEAMGIAPTKPSEAWKCGNPKLLALDMRSAAEHFKVKVPIRQRQRKSQEITGDSKARQTTLSL